MKKAYFALLTLSLCFLNISGFAYEINYNLIEPYVAQYKRLAVAEMQHSGIPASITLAQGILESNSGTSHLAVQGNNHFGIKCHKTWTGDRLYYNDDAPNECFRKYNMVYDSYKDHSNFLSSRDRYSELFYLSTTDYHGWAHGLKKAGYATNPNYANLLISLVDRYDLNQFDTEVTRNDYPNYPTTPPVVSQPSTPPVVSQPSTPTPPPVSTPKQPQVEQACSYITQGSLPSPLPAPFTFNGIRTVRFDCKVSQNQIARAYGISTNKLRRFNDLSPSQAIEGRTKIYLKPKKRKAANGKHMVKEGESMHAISQQHGIKLKRLYKLNRMKPGTQAAVGEVLSLRTKRKTTPRLGSRYGRNSSTSSTSVNTSSNSSSPRSSGNTRPSPRVRSSNKAKTGTSTRPRRTPTTTPSTGTNQPAYRTTHTVQAGDTLYAISKRYGITVDSIKRMNGLHSNELSIGMQLKIPY